MNYMIDSREFQVVESMCSAELSHVPSQPAIVPSLSGMLSRDQILRLDTWNLLGTSGNVFHSPRAVIDSSSTPYQGMLHSWNQNATGGNPVRERKKSRDDSNAEIFEETINLEFFFLSSRKIISTELRD